MINQTFVRVGCKVAHILWLFPWTFLRKILNLGMTKNKHYNRITVVNSMMYINSFNEAFLAKTFAILCYLYLWSSFDTYPNLHVHILNLSQKIGYLPICSSKDIMLLSFYQNDDLNNGAIFAMFYTTSFTHFCAIPN